jgi:PAS domain-containing protein
VQAEKLLLKNDFLKSLFHALPSATFVVDSDVRLLLWNDAAGTLVGRDASKVYRQRGGEVLHCIHSNEGGCGHASACRTCVVREAVNEAFQGGTVRRRRAVLELLEGDVVRRMPVLITTSPFSAHGGQYSVLIVENIGEIIQLRDLIPICARCKKIRNDKDYWESVEQYIARNVIDIDFSPGFCPDCSVAILKEGKRS